MHVGELSVATMDELSLSFSLSPCTNNKYNIFKGNFFHVNFIYYFDENGSVHLNVWTKVFCSYTERQWQYF